jgi:hypothetical protein
MLIERYEEIMDTKLEIDRFFKNYVITIDDTFLNDKELKMVLNYIRNCNSFEKPDGYLLKKNSVYAIEHFQISQYKLRKNQDVSRIAKGSQKNREKMNDDRNFDLEPSVHNLIVSLERNLKSHSNSFQSYKTNILNINDCNEKVYKLIIFIEDSTESGYIVRNRETKIINPLKLRQLAEIILKYKTDVWGVIYSYGNEKNKILTGCTLKDLEEQMNNGKLFDSNDYVPFEVGKNIHVSKSDKTKDSNTIKIKFNEHI